MMNLHDKVIEDCIKCIDLDNKYIKCYSRLLKSYTIKGEFDKGVLFIMKAKENGLYDENSSNNLTQQFVSEVKEFYHNKDSYEIAYDNFDRKNYTLAAN